MQKSRCVRTARSLRLVMLDRSEFLWSLLILGIGACGNDSDSDSDPDDIDASVGTDDAPMVGPQVCIEGTTIIIGSNHNHTMVVPAEDVAAGVDKSYDITGTSNHPHTVVLAATDFAKLANGEMVTVVSSYDDDHTHTVYVHCV